MRGPQPAQRRRNGKGPFRGPTPPKVFQTLDAGAGKGEYIERLALRSPQRKYAAADIRYAIPGAPVIPGKGAGIYAKRLGNSGVATYGEMGETIEEFIQKGIRTRHVNMDFPYPWSAKGGFKYERMFGRLLEKIPFVLLPNGHFFITSEDAHTVVRMEEIAHKMGFKTRRLSPLALEKHKKKPGTMLQTFAKTGYPVYRLRITMGLKKAIPQKEKRKRWPE